jgi:hypothetical protein
VVKKTGVKTQKINMSSRSINTLYYTVPIFLSSFLLFQVQPITGKYLLPLFGGSSAVWNTCLLFYQCLLVCGYLYAHMITRQKIRFQVFFHLLLLVFVLLIMSFLSSRWGTPIMPQPVLDLSSLGSPVIQIFLVLTASVGLPFFLLSATSTLIQSWFSRVNNKKSPYSFYAVSNTASLVALVSYPVFFEQAWPINRQAWIWFVIYTGFTLSIIWTIFKVNQSCPGKINDHDSGTNPLMDKEGFVSNESKPGFRSYLYWISLSAAASVMLLSVTNRISMDIAPVPFMWVLTLSLYLLSFVLTFVNIRMNSQKLWLVLLTTALCAAWICLKLEGRFDVAANILIHSFVLFACCIFCHSQLFYSKPHPLHLTSFYLAMACGGALGGLMVNIFAPAFFKGFWEFHFGLIYCAMTAIIALFGQKIFKQYYFRLSGIILLSFFLFLISIDLVSNIRESKGACRNFYGLLQLEHSIVNNVRITKLFHNSIMHGLQFSKDPYRYEPTSYFIKESGVGLAFGFHPNRQSGKSINAGAIGLGIGTLAAYGRQGDDIKFYEINPDVIRLASKTRWFSYIGDSQANIDVVFGDARLSLENELESSALHHFDILVIDAFSGDSIPVHLLTKEAFDLYFAHLKKDGIIAIHISNRYIDFEPVFQAVVKHFDMKGIVVETLKKKHYNSKWVLITRNNAFLADPHVDSAGRGLKKSKEIKLWTDEYNSLWQVLK